MGTLVIVAFLAVIPFLSFLKPKPAQPTIDSYGQQACGVPQERSPFIKSSVHVVSRREEKLHTFVVIATERAKRDAKGGRSHRTYKVKSPHSKQGLRITLSSY
ncbi:MAG: hypothetical protein V7L29_01010 [Nostoc sp.]|uniref:hypothetical protein n=1 Tax=Nostoc sp. TaxID=1180 RepID=UPI002FF9990A